MEHKIIKDFEYLSNDIRIALYKILKDVHFQDQAIPALNSLDTERGRKALSAHLLENSYARIVSQDGDYSDRIPKIKSGIIENIDLIVSLFGNKPMKPERLSDLADEIKPESEIKIKK